MERTLDALKKAKSVIVCSHTGPDGDAMASTLALGMGLEQLGKKVTYYNRDTVPSTLRFLPGADKVIHHLDPKSSYDAAVTVDCGSLGRLGHDFIEYKGYKQLINVDHHASNDEYGDVNYIIPDAASTGEVAWSLLKALGCKLTRDIAMNVYCTLVTDTGSFRYSNTTAGTLRLASEMVEAGADPDLVSQNLFESHPLVTFVLLRRLLEGLKVSEDGRYSWAVIFQKDLDETKATYEVTEEFINYPRAIKGVEVAMLFKEWDDNSFKVSMRSKGETDVSLICKSFGGGGHRKAAACVIPGSFEDVRSKVFSKLESALKKIK